jgi:hypothetical protein
MPNALGGDSRRDTSWTPTDNPAIVKVLPWPILPCGRQGYPDLHLGHGGPCAHGRYHTQKMVYADPGIVRRQSPLRECLPDAAYATGCVISDNDAHRR